MTEKMKIGTTFWANALKDELFIYFGEGFDEIYKEEVVYVYDVFGMKYRSFTEPEWFYKRMTTKEAKRELWILVPE
jgi:hypothetical protein